MEIKILGPEGPQSVWLERLTRGAARVLGLQPTFTRIADPLEFAAYGVDQTPALVIDEEVASAGRIPSMEEIIAWMGIKAGIAIPREFWRRPCCPT